MPGACLLSDLPSPPPFNTISWLVPTTRKTWKLTWRDAVWDFADGECGIWSDMYISASRRHLKDATRETSFEASHEAKQTPRDPAGLRMQGFSRSLHAGIQQESAGVDSAGVRMQGCSRSPQAWIQQESAGDPAGTQRMDQGLSKGSGRWVQHTKGGATTTWVLIVPQQNRAVCLVGRWDPKLCLGVS